ncbi:hypothetical protein RAS1_13560 [Phycisphaerae bacterium RAS1]|nr:hypothetical protein RAS1_13560 [Phycisphaerae bacterium RAS1]
MIRQLLMAATICVLCMPATDARAWVQPGGEPFLDGLGGKSGGDWWRSTYGGFYIDHAVGIYPGPVCSTNILFGQIEGGPEAGYLCVWACSGSSGSYLMSNPPDEGGTCTCPAACGAP